jgi:PAS domain S-box-containing protein
MDSLIKKLSSAIATAEEPRMELPLFRLLCLSATALSILVVMPTDYLHHLPLTVVCGEFVFGMLALFLYRESRQGRHHIAGLFFLFMLALNVTWFANGGSLGSIGYYFFTIFIFPLIFFRGRKRWLLWGFAIMNGVGLIAAEQHLQQWVIPYQSQQQRVADLMTSLTVSAVYCSLMLWAVLSGYDREQRRLRSLNGDLEQNMARRLEAEKSLGRNRELLNAVVEGTSDAIYAKDTCGRYLLFNSAAALMMGKSVHEALGSDDSRLYPPDMVGTIMRNDNEVLAKGEILSVELPLIDANGDLIVWQATKGPLRDAQGAIVGIFGIARDVTDSRRTAEELRKLNDELELRVLERTKRLETAMREQEAFSYSVSHDLRGPLRHINCYTAILEEDFGASLNPEAREYLERIRNSSSRMAGLIDDLLELSRIGRSNLAKAPISLSELARVICSKLQEAEPERLVEFVIEPGLTAQGDRVLLSQMLENLIGNAWKYSGLQPSARIEVGAIRDGEQQAYFVKDDGVGFDMAYQDKLFGAFQRLHGSEFEGTGIGLATVKRIVERHGGSVWAKGAVNQGATIYFVLP